MYSWWRVQAIWGVKGWEVDGYNPNCPNIVWKVIQCKCCNRDRSGSVGSGGVGPVLPHQSSSRAFAQEIQMNEKSNASPKPFSACVMQRCTSTFSHLLEAVFQSVSIDSSPSSPVGGYTSSDSTCDNPSPSSIVTSSLELAATQPRPRHVHDTGVQLVKQQSHKGAPP